MTVTADSMTCKNGNCIADSKNGVWFQYCSLLYQNVLCISLLLIKLAYFIPLRYLAGKGFHNHLLSIKLSFIELWNSNVVNSFMPVRCTKTPSQWHRNGFGCCSRSLVWRRIVRQWSIHVTCTPRLLIPIFNKKTNNKTFTTHSQYKVRVLKYYLFSKFALIFRTEKNYCNNFLHYKSWIYQLTPQLLF